ncbi:MAG: hypothetical protein EXS32_05355 [Opitutus sp.]|nr:hypothetical protein [Opitutus sp.]
MLSLLKKKSDASAEPAVPAWHPNFRNYEKLPDIKVVRTAFFVNGAAVSLALALGINFGFQEWQLHVLHNQIVDWQRQIDHDQKESNQAVALFKKFQAEEVKIIEVETFVRSKPVVSELLFRLGQTLPANIAIDSLDLRENGLSLHLTVRGAPDTAAGYAHAYLEQLRADKEFTRFDDFQMPNVVRNTTTGRLSVDVFMRLRAPAKKP